MGTIQATTPGLTLRERTSYAVLAMISFCHFLNDMIQSLLPAIYPLLRDTFLFWRISKGGPGLPEEGGPWDTAMPAWEKFLKEDEIWDAILFLYDHTGTRPRAREEAATK